MKRSHLVALLVAALALDALLAGALALRLVRPAEPPFAFDVDHGRCACAFDDDGAAWDFARNRARIERTVCRGAR